MASPDTFTKSKWIELCRNLGVTDSVTCKWWERIRDYYAESGRHFHNIAHVSDMMKLLEEYEHLLRNSKEVAMAIYFHDIVYNPKLSDNEERSADFFKEFAAEALTSEKEINTDNVMRLILETKLHHTEAHEGVAFGTEDLHYFLDLDMSILGRNESTYAQYAADIRKEYIHIPLPDYCQRRAEFLSTFLKTKKIFCTDEFYRKYEFEARRNVQQEINLLNQNRIPPQVQVSV